MNTPPEGPQRRAFVLLGAGMALAAAGQSLRPGNKTAIKPAAFDLNALIPLQIGDWAYRPIEARVVNPQTQELLDKIYSQIVERLYVNPAGYVLMIAVAYGADQRGTLETHKPEVCYPAQGFKIKANQEVGVATAHGPVHARRLYTENGQRQEPLTYWFTISNTQVNTRFEKRLQQIKSAVTGQIPDGILFRVSSIDTVPEHAWKMQASFIQDLSQQLNTRDRQRLIGLGE